MYPRRMLLAAYARMALWIVGVVFVAWLLLGSNLVNDFFTFWLSGNVPGTHIILSPNIAMLVAAGCLSLIFGTFLIRTYARHIRRQIGPVWKAAPRQVAVVTSPVGAESQRDERRSNFGVSRIIRFRVILAVWRQYSTATIGGVVAKIAGMLRRIGHMLLIAVARIIVIALISTGYMYRLVLGAVRYLGGQLISLWQFIEPSLWRLDGWLEKRTHEASSRVTKFMGRFELTLALQEIIKNYKEPAASLQPIVDEQNPAVEPRDS